MGLFEFPMADEVNKPGFMRDALPSSSTSSTSTSIPNFAKTTPAAKSLATSTSTSVNSMNNQVTQPNMTTVKPPFSTTTTSTPPAPAASTASPTIANTQGRLINPSFAAGLTDMGATSQPAAGLKPVAEKASAPAERKPAGEGEAVMLANGKETRIKNAPDRPKGLMDTAYFQKYYNSPLGNSKTNDKDAFNEWAKKASAAYGGNILDQQTHYDLQGLFMSGFKPEDVKNGLPEMFMKPNHPNVGPSSQYYDKQLLQMLNPDERGLPEGATAWAAPGDKKRSLEEIKKSPGMREITAKAGETGQSKDWKDLGKNEYGFTKFSRPAGDVGWRGPEQSPQRVLEDSISEINGKIEEADAAIKGYHKGDFYRDGGFKYDSLEKTYNQLMQQKATMTEHLATIASGGGLREAEAEEKRAKTRYWDTAGSDIKKAQAEQARANAEWIRAGRPTQGKTGNPATTLNKLIQDNIKQDQMDINSDVSQGKFDADAYRIKIARRYPGLFKVDDKTGTIMDVKTNQPVFSGALSVPGE